MPDAPKTQRELELEQALVFANKKLRKRTKDSRELKHELEKITDTRIFLIYLLLRKSINAPRRFAKEGKKAVYHVAKHTMKTDKTRRLAIGTAKKVRRLVPHKSVGKNTRLFVDSLDATRRSQYKQWVKNHYPTQQKLEEQRQESRTWSYQPLVSILVPTYNTDHAFLRDAIESVQNQSYENWELCIADDTSTDEKVRTIIKEYAKKDKRIKYVFRKTNGHISEASNSALEIAQGEFVGLLDHDDVLWPNALYENIRLVNNDKTIDLLYSDEEKISEDGKHHEDPYFKPDWSPDQLRCHNYITHFAVLRTSIIKKIGGFRKGCEGAQDWDLLIRFSREARTIKHIPTILYSWRKAQNSTALRADAKDYAWTVQEKVLQDDLEARNVKGKVMATWILGFWRVEYALTNMPLVSIVIPTKDQYELINQCLKSIAKKTTYPNYEVVVVDTGSSDEKVWKLYEEYADENVRVEKWTKPFNFSSVCNFGARKAKGDYLLFLNNDTEIITPDWIENLLGYAQQDHVGAVGCKLLYPNDHIQHAGIVLGMGGFPDTPAIAGHIFAGWDNELQDQYKIMLTEAVRDSSAVTAACLMISRQKFDQVKGFDESFKIAFNDVDFCLKLRSKNLYNVYVPFTQLYHHESVSVGRVERSGRDLELFKEEHRRMGRKWGEATFENDKFLNPNYSLHGGYIEIKADALSVGELVE